MTALDPLPLFVGPLLNGISEGVILVMIAMGLTLVFGFLRVLNFAHGAFYMSGGFVLFSVLGVVGNYWVAVLVAPLLIGALGVLSERLLLRPTYDVGAITQFIITVGLSFVLKGLIVIYWGPSSKNVNIPSQLSGSVDLLGVSYPQYRLFVTVVGVISIVGVWVFLRYSDIGLAIRASLYDTEMAQALGYDIPFIYTLVFAASITIAALAGALMTPLDGVSPETGDAVILDAFIVVIIGGLGSFRGTVIAGMGVGMADVLIARYVAFHLSGLTIFAILLLVLVIRPNGLFGETGVFE